MEQFEFVLLDRETVDEFIRCLYRSEPNGYDTIPPENMNVAYGVMEKSSGIILTRGYEPSRGWIGKEGDHPVVYVVKCNEGCFTAQFDTNAYGDNWEYAKIFGKNGAFYKYTDVTRKAIKFYCHDCCEEYKKFCDLFEETHGEDLFRFKHRMFQEARERWSFRDIRSEPETEQAALENNAETHTETTAGKNLSQQRDKISGIDRFIRVGGIVGVTFCILTLLFFLIRMIMLF